MNFILSFNIAAFVKAAGYLGILGIVFAESGLFLGFFLPGDSLIFTAGFLASRGYLNIAVLIAVCFAGAVSGDSFGYAFGKKTGPRIFKKEDSLLFKKSHLEKAKIFYEAHGGKTLILARFMPIVRTFAPILAGVGEMNYSVFLVYNAVGGALWAAGLPILGYLLGNIIPNIDRYIAPFVILIIILSVLPPFIHAARRGEIKWKKTKN